MSCWHASTTRQVERGSQPKTLLLERLRCGGHLADSYVAEGDECHPTVLSHEAMASVGDHMIFPSASSSLSARDHTFSLEGRLPDERVKRKIIPKAMKLLTPLNASVLLLVLDVSYIVSGQRYSYVTSPHLSNVF